MSKVYVVTEGYFDSPLIAFEARADAEQFIETMRRVDEKRADELEVKELEVIRHAQ